MSITRRHFILGTGAGLILPSYYDKVLAYCENYGEALLETPETTKIELIAMDWGWSDGFELNWGDPRLEPPEMTVREFARRYCGGEEAYRLDNGLEDDDEVDFDAQMEQWVVDENWSWMDSPRAKAYRLLENIDLGPDFFGDNAVGEIQFINGPCPGSDYRAVLAPSHVDLSLLQKRLNELNTGIRIRVEVD